MRVGVRVRVVRVVRVGVRRVTCTFAESSSTKEVISPVNHAVPCSYQISTKAPFVRPCG